MMDDQTSRFPAHRTIVTAHNTDTVRCTLPEDQHEAIAVGCMTWRMPDDVDTWVESCGSTLTYWPETQRGALHHDGDPDGSAWGTWRGGELRLDDGIAVDVMGRILHVWLGSISVATHDHGQEIEIADP